LVERDLAKVEVAGSSPVFRSYTPDPVMAGEGGTSPAPNREIFFEFTLVAEQVDAQDLKSCLQKCGYGFDSRLGYFRTITQQTLKAATANALVAFSFF
jgi:hypothetical protein